ncbi:hypothetical protein FKP32DRAFT_1592334 [Trametes sanguinea]|nr:hypothetical protein FKP32DRAFT_1592334 [Trametes sanguinea]
MSPLPDPTPLGHRGTASSATPAKTFHMTVLERKRSRSPSLTTSTLALMSGPRVARRPRPRPQAPRHPDELQPLPPASLLHAPALRRHRHKGAAPPKRLPRFAGHFEHCEGRIVVYGPENPVMSAL